MIAVVIENIAPPDSPRIAIAVGPEQERKSESTSGSAVRIHGNLTVEQEGLAVLGDFNEVWQLTFPENPTNEDLDRIMMKVEDYRSGNTPTILEPGNSVVKHFVLRARRWLFFSPIAYTFQIQVRYAVDGKENVDSLSYALNIRAALRATIIGAVVGGVLGSAAKALGMGGAGHLSLSTIILSAILGAVAVVAFARRSAAQQIVSVEDAWGGLLIGFLVGYIGEGYFRQILGAGG